MFNLVEMCADEQKPAPCKWGNVVVGHACYCHNDEWTDGPRKCPIYRQFGDQDATKWHRREWELVELPGGVRLEMRPCMPDDDLGGCPRYEPANAKLCGGA